MIELFAITILALSVVLIEMERNFILVKVKTRRYLSEQRKYRK